MATKVTTTGSQRKPSGPAAAVKQLHGSKEQLVASLVGPLSEGVPDADEDALRARLATASNQKLIHLAGVVAEVKKRYGNRSKMIALIAGAQKKDNDYLAKLATIPLPRLLDLARAGERRAKRA